MDDRKEVNRRLVNEVKEWHLLYDTNNINYNKRKETKEAWEEIARKVSEEFSKDKPYSVDQCKDRWTRLRAAYASSLNDNGSSSYYLAEEMMFLNPFINRNRRSSGRASNVSQQETEADPGHSGSAVSVVGQSSQSPGSHDTSQPPTSSPSSPSTAPSRTPKEEGLSTEEYTLNQLRKLSIQTDPAKKAERATQGNSTESDALTIQVFLSNLKSKLELLNENQLKQFEAWCVDAIKDILSSPQ